VLSTAVTLLAIQGLDPSAPRTRRWRLYLRRSRRRDRSGILDGFFEQPADIGRPNHLAIRRIERRTRLAGVVERPDLLAVAILREVEQQSNY
jgi:hypothetical protein